MDLNPSTIAEVSKAREKLWRPWYLIHWVDPEQLSKWEVDAFIAQQKRNAACAYLWVPKNCDDTELQEAEDEYVAWIDAQLAIFNAQRSSAMIIEEVGNASSRIVS